MLAQHVLVQVPRDARLFAVAAGAAGLLDAAERVHQVVERRHVRGRPAAG